MASNRDLYTEFRAAIARQVVPVGPKGDKWIYYSGGEKTADTIVCIHGTSGTADVFYNQISSLSSRGYRVVACTFPPYFTIEDWVRGFDRFLDALQLRKIHLLGVSLGGFLSLHYVKRHPDRVTSLVLCNAFCDTIIFHEHAPWLTMFRYMPEFMVKKYVLDNFPQGELDEDLAAAVDFVVQQFEEQSRDSVASRLTLNCLNSTIHSLDDFSLSKITVIDTLDGVSLPEEMRERLYKLLDGVKMSPLKLGGDFPYLSQPEEFTMLLQVHLRSHGAFPLRNETTTNSLDHDEKAQIEAKIAAEEEAVVNDLSTSVEDSSSQNGHVLQSGGLGNRPDPAKATSYDEPGSYLI